MEIFYNSKRPGYDEIVSYGPKWWTEYREMEANYRYAGWSLDLMAHFLEQTVKNQFPDHADEKTIMMLEKLLKIEYDPGTKLDERRRIVSAYYSGMGKLSKSVIQSVIQTYGGCESKLWWKDRSSLQIRIFCNEGNAFSNKRIFQIIERRFPAHLLFMIRNVLCTFFTEEVFSVDRVRHRTWLSWWDDSLDGSFPLDGSLLLAAAFPPFFGNKYPFVSENALTGRMGGFIGRHRLLNRPDTEWKTRQKIAMNWWEELRTLDGRENLNGTCLLDQDALPRWGRETHRMNILGDEVFGITMYIPGMAKLLDGSVMLDGTIRLNSGREEL